MAELLIVIVAVDVVLFGDRRTLAIEGSAMKLLQRGIIVGLSSANSVFILQYAEGWQAWLTSTLLIMNICLLSYLLHTKVK